jgi:hypothetical protein
VPEALELLGIESANTLEPSADMTRPAQLLEVYGPATGVLKVGTAPDTDAMYMVYTLYEVVPSPLDVKAITVPFLLHTKKFIGDTVALVVSGTESPPYPVG